MTKDINFKREVRARAEKTGESYTAARQHVLRTRSHKGSAPTGPLRISVAQMPVHNDPRDADLLRASGLELRRLMETAKALGARLIHFPEGATCFPHKAIMSSTGTETIGEADWTRFRWDVLQEELRATRALAGQLGLWTVFGSVHRLTSPHRPHNSLYVISDKGEIVTRYDERMLSKTKLSFMYAPGSAPSTFEIDGYRLGCAIGMESHFGEIFSEYEELAVDVVLFSTTGGFLADAPMFAAGACGHAATNNFWISFSVPSEHSVGAPSGIIAPNGTWAKRCPADGASAVTVFDVEVDRSDYSRPWRRMARSGIYAEHQVADDRRSEDRGTF